MLKSRGQSGLDAMKFWSRPRPQSFGLGLGLYLGDLALASNIWSQLVLSLVVLASL